MMDYETVMCVWVCVGGVGLGFVCILNGPPRDGLIQVSWQFWSGLTQTKPHSKLPAG